MSNPVDNPVEYCRGCREQVVRYEGEEGCPFCGGTTCEFGDLIDEAMERAKDARLFPTVPNGKEGVDGIKIPNPDAPTEPPKDGS